MASRTEFLNAVLRWTLGSGGVLAVLAGVVPVGYDAAIGPSIRAQRAVDALDVLTPAIAAHRSEADRVRSGVRRASTSMLRGGDLKDAADRFDDLSLMVSDYQTTSADLKKLTIEILAPRICQPLIRGAAKGVEGTEDCPEKSLEAWRVLPDALQNAINAAEFMSECVDSTVRGYGDKAIATMRDLRTQPLAEGARDPADIDNLLCRRGGVKSRLTSGMEGLDGCSTAIRHALINIRDDLEEDKRENAWSRTWNDFWSWVTGSGDKGGRDHLRLAELRADDAERLAADCAPARLRHGSDDAREQTAISKMALTPWENRLPEPAPAMAPDLTAPAPPEPAAATPPPSLPLPGMY